MNQTELKENFKEKLNIAVSEINNLEAQIAAKRELALKLKGAIEALEILEQQQEEPTETE